LQKSFAPIRIERGLGAAELRALAHPLRLRLLEVLREGPATASQLGRALGESSGATSYHLRVLAKHGLVEDDGARNRGRERPWRRAEEQMTIVAPSPAEEPEHDAAMARLREVFLERDEHALASYFAHAAESGPWAEEAFIGGWTVYATPTEIGELTRTLLEAIDPLRRAPDERPSGARRVYVTWRALPQPDERP
jgi:DNA-binding transcriptional ArsR family regulator